MFLHHIPAALKNLVMIISVEQKTHPGSAWTDDRVLVVLAVMEQEHGRASSRWSCTYLSSSRDLAFNVNSLVKISRRPLLFFCAIALSAAQVSKYFLLLLMIVPVS